MTRESIPSPEYARLEERIVARDQKGASDVLYGLFKQHRPAIEILRETVRIHAPFTHVPYHQRLDDGIVKFVNNDHCLLSERVGLPLMSMVRPELAWLPLAQTVWYMPPGLDPWNQLLGKRPGHYTRLSEIAVHQEPPTPEIHWPDQEPLRTDGPIGERLNHWPRDDRSRQRDRLGACAQRALCRRAGHRRRAALVLDVRDGWQRRPEPPRRPRRRAAEADRRAHAGRGGDAGRGHHARARNQRDRGDRRAPQGWRRAAADPRRDPGRRRAGDPRDRRREQLLDVTARLRVLQHARFYDTFQHPHRLKLLFVA